MTLLTVNCSLEETVGVSGGVHHDPVGVTSEAPTFAGIGGAAHADGGGDNPGFVGIGGGGHDDGGIVGIGGGGHDDGGHVGIQGGGG